VRQTKTGQAPARIRRVDFDDAALRLIAEAAGSAFLDLSFGTHPAGHSLTLDVTPTAPTGDTLLVFGQPGGILRAHCRAVPYAVATILIALGDVTGCRPRCAFPWPARGLPRALAVVLLGHGDTPAHVRALLRRLEPDRTRRPVVQLYG
jgi:hypothetical protein